MKNIHFKEIKIFENYKIIEKKDDYVILETEVVESSLNLFKNAHGGYLYSLCDSLSGYVIMKDNITKVVTLSSSINYIKGAKLGDILYVKANIIHNGRRTKVVETTITNQDQKTIVKAQFTMYAIN